MGYDAANGGMILFSGYGLDDSRDAYDDAWAHDPQTNSRTEMKPASCPPDTRILDMTEAGGIWIRMSP